MRGRAAGAVARATGPINFLGSVDKATGVVREGSGCGIGGRALRGAVLVFPHGSGSSVGAYTIYSLKSHGVAPAAMVCEKADMAVATGCAAAGIPMVVAGPAEYGALRDGARAVVDTDAGVVRPEAGGVESPAPGRAAHHGAARGGLPEDRPAEP